MSKKKQYRMCLALFLLAIALILGGIVHRHRQLYSMDRPRKILVRDLHQEGTPLVPMPPEKFGTSSREINWHLAGLLQDYDPGNEDPVKKHNEISVETMKRLNLIFPALESGYVPVSIVDDSDTRPSSALIIFGMVLLSVAGFLFLRVRQRTGQPFSGVQAGKAENSSPALLLLILLLFTSGCRKSPNWETHYERGNIYFDRGQYVKAETCFLKALKELEKFGTEDRRVGLVLNDLAMAYEKQGMYDDAEPLYRRSLTIIEKVFGPNDLKAAASLNNLASVCSALEKSAEAEAFYRRSLAIHKKCVGRNHPDVAISLNNLAVACQRQAKYVEAEFFLEEALGIWKALYGPAHPSVALGLCNLADLYQVQKNYRAAEPLYMRAIAITEEAQGRDNPNDRQALMDAKFGAEVRDHRFVLVRVLGNYAELLRKTGREAEAATLETRAEAIEKAE